ncbi:glycosyl hydrolase 115 family protein [Zunongwangia pacifica]|nr:glycosyl hydrolase 115 family protein [Zunongwangia pacifica]
MIQLSNSVKNSSYLFSALCILLSCVTYGQKTMVSHTSAEGSFGLVTTNKTAELVLDASDFEGVAIAAKNLQKDIERVTGKLPKLRSEVNKNGNVIIGTLGKNKMIDSLIQHTNIDVSKIRGKWEAHTIKKIGEDLLIIGSDKRGTIFGIYELSRQIGVSPWYWWADVPVKKAEELYIDKDGFTSTGPKVQYRGIFINDEAPALSSWVSENYGKFNHEFYEPVFELILRLKGNYLWPAMWGKAFYDDDPANGVLADKYGIVMGTSHHEPLMRAQAEWGRYGSGEWNYETNADTLRSFWRKGIERMGDRESLVTIGMRGDGDEPMTEGTAISLLERIVKDQREIISDVTHKPAKETPQVWALYKEVQDYYDQGMRVPDDVTLLLADDNWGNIRKLPKLKDSTRSGGYGIYYHFDYVGGPRSYKWINTSQISRVYEQMSLAYAYHARKVWIVNVGDLKPMEYPISFFLDYAWNPENFKIEELKAYPEQWAAAQFGAKYAPEIGELLQKYTTYNSRRKPELLSDKTYSLTQFNEAEEILTEFNELEKKAEEIAEKLDAKYQSAYFQLVLHPVKASANLNRMYIALAKNKLYAEQQRNTTNRFAEKVSEYFENDEALTSAYHTIEDGKWNHMIFQPHIGYSAWFDPKQNIKPETTKIEVPEAADLGVAIADSEDYFPKNKHLSLPIFDKSNTESYVEIFNRGKEELEIKLKKLPKWLKASKTKAKIGEQERIFLALVPENLPGKNTKDSFVVQADDQKVEIAVSYQPFSFKPEGFTAKNGVISIPANKFVENKAWEIIPDLGRRDIALRPESSFTQEATENASLTYLFSIKEDTEATLSFLISPSLDFLDNGGLKFAYSIDGGELQTLNLLKDTKDHWGISVSNNITKVIQNLNLEKGVHQLKVYAIDPGIVLQHIIIETNTSNLLHTYLAPKE